MKRHYDGKKKREPENFSEVDKIYCGELDFAIKYLIDKRSPILVEDDDD